MSGYSLDVTEADFDEKVVEASRTTPVLVDFWAEWCGPCRVLKPLLEKLAVEYEGRFVLAKIDSDENMRIAGRFGIRGIPTVIMFADGEEKERFSGAQPEPTVRAMIDRYLSSPVKELLHAAHTVLVEGQAEQAVHILRDAMELEPQNVEVSIAMAEALLVLEKYSQARSLLQRIRFDDRVQALLARIDVAERGKSAGDAGELKQRVEADPGDLAGRMALADALTVAGRLEEAMDQLLAVIEADPGFREGAPRHNLLEIFQLLGNSGEVVSRYRRRLAALLN